MAVISIYDLFKAVTIEQWLHGNGFHIYFALKAGCTTQEYCNLLFHPIPIPW